MTVETWQQAEAAALEVRADNIRAAIDSLDRIDGMYTGRRELAESLASTRALLSTDELNVRARITAALT